VYFVVCGAGRVGSHLAETLTMEGHEVAVIEKDPVAFHRLQSLDVQSFEGSASRMDLLTEAAVDRADALIAVTGDDEANLVAAALAKSLGAKRTIARVNSADYLSRPFSHDYRRIGVDIAVCPDLVAAERISVAVATPDLMNVDLFAARRVHVLEVPVRKRAPAAGKEIRELKVPEGVNLIAVFRGGETQPARGNTVIHPGSRVLVAMVKPESVFDVEALLGKPTAVASRPVKRLMIAGATRIGIHLARLLEKERSVVIVDEDEERCRMATEQLDKTLVIQGNATDRQVLLEEDVQEMDAFVGAHPKEEYNIFSALLAKNLGVPRAVAMIHQAALRDLVEDLDVDLAVDPKRATVGTILQHLHEETKEVVMTRGGEGQILEIVVSEDSWINGRALQDDPFPKQATVCAIARGDEVILPRGGYTFQPGDRVIVYARQDAVKKIEELF
jgi:trk system potassium uptake protein